MKARSPGLFSIGRHTGAIEFSWAEFNPGVTALGRLLIRSALNYFKNPARELLRLRPKGQ